MTLIELYKAMYEHTKNECSFSCRVPNSCCEEMYCDIAKKYAKEKYGVDLKPTGHPTIPFMGKDGCTVEPHLRPICTVHTCEINEKGYKRNDQKWTDEYFRLRDLIETHEEQPKGGKKHGRKMLRL